MFLQGETSIIEIVLTHILTDRCRFTHLQHVPYTISLQVNNDSGAQRLGMVRVFLAPKFDERGSALLFRDQRHLMIELDKFVTACMFISEK